MDDTILESVECDEKGKDVMRCAFCGFRIFPQTEFVNLGGDVLLHGDCYMEHQQFVEEMCK